MKRFTVTATLEVPDKCGAQDVARYAADALASYRSPTHFFRGHLHALYASATDEVADRRPGVGWPEHRRLCRVCARTPEDWASGEDSDYQSHCERGWGLRLAHEGVRRG